MSRYVSLSFLSLASVAGFFLTLHLHHAGSHKPTGCVALSSFKATIQFSNGSNLPLCYACSLPYGPNDLNFHPDGKHGQSCTSPLAGHLFTVALMVFRSQEDRLRGLIPTGTDILSYIPWLASKPPGSILPNTVHVFTALVDLNKKAHGNPKATSHSMASTSHNPLPSQSPASTSPSMHPKSHTNKGASTTTPPSAKLPHQPDSHVSPQLIGAIRSLPPTAPKQPADAPFSTTAPSNPVSRKEAPNYRSPTTASTQKVSLSSSANRRPSTQSLQGHRNFSSHCISGNEPSSKQPVLQQSLNAQASSANASSQTIHITRLKSLVTKFSSFAKKNNGKRPCPHCFAMTRRLEKHDGRFCPQINKKCLRCFGQPHSTLSNGSLYPDIAHISP